MKTPVHLPHPTVSWHLTVHAGDTDPLVFARVLQKAAVPEIALEAAAYARNPARLELTVTCSEARAELTRRKLERLLDVRAVILHRVPSARAPYGACA